MHLDIYQSTNWLQQLAFRGKEKKGKESAKKGEKGKLVPDELCTILDL